MGTVIGRLKNSEMKNLLFLLALGLVFFTTLSFINTEKALQNQETKDPINKNISAKEFKKLIDAGNGILLDVRTTNEVEQGTIEGAINIDYYSLDFKKNVSKLNKNKAIYVYCRSGNRSGKTMQIMTDLGFVEVYNLIGGYGAWPFK